MGVVERMWNAWRRWSDKEVTSYLISDRRFWERMEVAFPSTVL
jgi:hypothetical protein